MSTIVNTDTAAENLLRRNHWITVAGLGVLTACAWAYLLVGAGTGMSLWAMTTWSFPPPTHSPTMADWTAAYWVIMLLMWWVMMIAMMTPSATPMVLLYARVSRHAQRKGRILPGTIPTAVFLLGYLLVWLAFSIAATALQWGLEYLGVLHGMFMWSISRTLSAMFLIATGLYQFSATKRVCLEHCQSPAEYLSSHWRDGRWGALRLGATHGTYCLGCCWAVMALLFVGGTMNLVWIAGLSIIVLLEKLTPIGVILAKTFGATMVLAGAWLLVS